MSAQMSQSAATLRLKQQSGVRMLLGATDTVSYQVTRFEKLNPLGPRWLNPIGWIDALIFHQRPPHGG